MQFRCNICGSLQETFGATVLAREAPSCQACRSSVRMRGIAHHLSVGLFGRSLALPEFPHRKDIVGIGLSDWEGYAVPLAARLGYTNTFFHQRPRLDITDPPADGFGRCDFLISTDVFEHVPPPVTRAFKGAFDLLRPGGLLVLTVPFSDIPEDIEHFPDLLHFAVVELGGEYVLVNRDHAGAISVRTGLVFHGGPGQTLEMRRFSRAGTVALLAAAGFTDIRVHAAAIPAWGILPEIPHGLPITARRPR